MIFGKRRLSALCTLPIFLLLIINFFFAIQAGGRGPDEGSKIAFSMLLPLPKTQEQSVKEAAPLSSAQQKKEKLVVVQHAATEIREIANYRPLDDVTREENEHFAVPVHLKEEPALSREVIMKEESSTGQKITRAYRLDFKNGAWVAQPLWTSVETPGVSDSLVRVAVDSVFRSFRSIE